MKQTIGRSAWARPGRRPPNLLPEVTRDRFGPIFGSRSPKAGPTSIQNSLGHCRPILAVSGRYSGLAPRKPGRRQPNLHLELTRPILAASRRYPGFAPRKPGRRQHSAIACRFWRLALRKPGRIQRRPTYKASFLGGRVPLDLRFWGPLEAKSFVRGRKIDPPRGPGKGLRS